MDHSYATSIEEELTCCVCTELFVDPHTPKELNCPHVLCQLCLCDIEEDGVIDCPQCRAITTLTSEGVAALRTNLSIRNLAEKHHRHVQKQDLERCGRLSIRSKNLNDPEIENIPKCPDHEDEMFFYCMTCGILVCQTCIATTHTYPQHDVKHIDAVRKQKMKTVNVLIGKLEKDAAQCQLKSQESGEEERDIMSSIRRFEDKIDMSLANAFKHGSAVKVKFRQINELKLKECRNRKKLMQDQANDKLGAVADARAIMRVSHSFVTQHTSLTDKLKCKLVSLTFAAIVLMCAGVVTDGIAKYCGIVFWTFAAFVSVCARSVLAGIYKFCPILSRSLKGFVHCSRIVIRTVVTFILTYTPTVLMLARRMLLVVVSANTSIVMVELFKLIHQLARYLMTATTLLTTRFIFKSKNISTAKKKLQYVKKNKTRKLTFFYEFVLSDYIISSIASNKTNSILAMAFGFESIHIYCKQPGGQYKKQERLSLRDLDFTYCNMFNDTYVAIDSDGNYWVALGWRVYVFSVSGKYVRMAIDTGCNICGISITPDNRNIILGCSSGVINVYKPDGTLINKIKGCRDRVGPDRTLINTIKANALFNTGEWLDGITAVRNTHVAHYGLYRVGVIEIATGRETLTIGFENEVSAICYDAETDCLLVSTRKAYKEYCLEQYSLATGRKVTCIAMGLTRPNDMTFTGDGVLAVADKKTVKIYHPSLL